MQTLHLRKIGIGAIQFTIEGVLLFVDIPSKAVGILIILPPRKVFSVHMVRV